MSAQILIVDDEPAIRRLVRGALERAGHAVDEAATAGEALTAGRREGCELVLLDLGLPDRDGMELVPLLKASGRAVIVLTARDATTHPPAHTGMYAQSPQSFHGLRRSNSSRASSRRWSSRPSMCPMDLLFSPVNPGHAYNEPSGPIVCACAMCT